MRAVIGGKRQLFAGDNLRIASRVGAETGEAFVRGLGVGS